MEPLYLHVNDAQVRSNSASQLLALTIPHDRKKGRDQATYL